MVIYVSMFWFLFFGTSCRLLNVSFSSVRICFVMQFIFCLLEICILLFSRRLVNQVLKAICFLIGMLPCVVVLLFSYIWNGVNSLVFMGLIWTAIYGKKMNLNTGGPFVLSLCIVIEITLFVVFFILSCIRGEETDHQVLLFSLSLLCYSIGVFESRSISFVNPEQYPETKQYLGKVKTQQLLDYKYAFENHCIIRKEYYENVKSVLKRS